MASQDDFIALWMGIFEAVDTSGDGLISEDEFMQMRGKIKNADEQKLFKELFTMVVNIKDGDIPSGKFRKAGIEAFTDKGPFPEMVLTMMKNLGSLSVAEKKLKEGKDKAVQELKAMFDKYDTDSSGTLDLAELKFFSAQMGSPLDEAELKSALADMDKSKTGEVNFSDLYEWWTHAERTKKTKGALAGLFVAAAEEYLSEAANDLFKGMAEKKAKTGDLSVFNGSFSLTVGDVDEKNCGGKLTVETFAPAEASEDTPWAQVDVTFKPKDPKLGLEAANAFKSLLRMVTETEKRMPPPISDALNKVAVKADEKSGTVTVSMFPPLMGPDPLALMPFKASDVLKAFKLELMTKANGMTTAAQAGKSAFDFLEFALKVSTSYNKDLVTSLTSKMLQPRGSGRRQKKKGMIMLAQMAFAGFSGSLKFNSPKSVYEMAKNMPAMKGLIPPEQLVQMESKQGFDAMCAKLTQHVTQMASRAPSEDAKAAFKDFFSKISALGSLVKLRGTHAKARLGVQLTASEGMVDLGFFPKLFQ